MKRVGVVSAALIFLSVLTGCMGGAYVNNDMIAETGKLAVVSVVIPRIADTTRESNRTVLQTVVDRAQVQVQSDLKNLRNWTVIDPANSKGAAGLSLPASDDQLAALFSSAKERKLAREIMERESLQWKQDFLGAKALPVVPRSAFVSDTARGHIMQKYAARLCDALNVDAVAFVQILAKISHPRPKTFLVTGNRTDGAIHAAQTLLVVDKRGRIIVDMGWPSLDKGARSRDLLPLYTGSGKDAVKPENIDLGDPKNKIVQAFSSLIEETATDMMKSLDKASAKK